MVASIGPALVAMLRAAIDRGELPDRLDLELATDLLIAPLAFRMLVTDGTSDDDYLESLATAIEAALKTAARQPPRPPQAA